MKLTVSNTSLEAGIQAAQSGAASIRDAIRERGSANVILATGASQFEMLETLLAEEALPWHRVTLFHLDEYVDLSNDHPASFRRYLWERFISKLPAPPSAFHGLSGEDNARKECARVGKLIGNTLIDVAFVGIGENGHLAFNDPPADFETNDPYIVVELDEACRRQQLGEGWFPSLEAVPTKAISMSIRQILLSKHVVCTVPDLRKAQAVADCFLGEISPHHPASALQSHSHCDVYLDKDSASLLPNHA